MKRLVAILASALFVFALSAPIAQGFDLPKLPGVSSGGAASTQSPDEVLKNYRNTLYSFVKAEFGLATAMNGSNDLAAQRVLLENMKTGDAAATKEDIQTLVSLNSAAKAEIDKKAAENTKLDASNKALASQSMLEYVRALVSMKKLAGSVQGLASNPVSLGANLGTVTYITKETPGLISKGASTTSTMFKYLGSNGVDLTEAKKEAAGLGV